MSRRAQITVKVPADIAATAIGYLQGILGPGADATEFLNDRIRYYPFRSVIKILERAQEITERREIMPQQLPLKFLVPLLEECSLEEEDSPSIERWANLLAVASGKFDPLHIAIKDVLKAISPAEANIIDHLGSQIRKERAEDDVSAHSVVESATGNVRNAVHGYLDGLTALPTTTDATYLCGDFIDGKPILPLYCQLPSTYLDDSEFLETDTLYEHRGSLYLLERLEVVKTVEFRLQYTAGPDSAEFIFAWLQLTPLGLEVYRHCVIPFERARSTEEAPKRRRNTRPEALRALVAELRAGDKRANS